MKSIKDKKNIDKLTIIAIIIPVILMALNLITTLITIGILGVQIVILLIKIKRKDGNINKKEIQILTFIIIFYLFTYIIDLFGKYRETTIITTTLVFINIILNYLIVCLTYNKKETFMLIAKIFVGFVIFLCAYGLVVRILGGTPRPYEVTNGETQYRQVVNIGGIQLSQRAMGNSQGRFGVTSLTKNPNTFSYLILYAFIINMILININKENNKKNIFNYLYMILLLIGVYIAGSRLAIVLIPLSYIGIKILSIKRKRFISFIIIGGIIAVLIVGIYLILNFDSLKLIDLNGRDQLWAIMPEVFDDSLIIGQGLDASRNIVLEKTGMDLTMFNSYFTMLANYGLIITVLFYAWAIYLVFYYLKKWKNEKKLKMKNLYTLIVMILIIALIQGIVENNILRFSVWNTIYVVLLTLGITIKDEDKEEMLI